MHTTQKTDFTLGIYGDGQLSKLLASKAHELNHITLIYTLDIKNSPCRGHFPLWDGKAWDDEGSFKRFAHMCDVIVLENEFVPPHFLTWAEENGKRTIPNAEAYSAVSDKWKQVSLAQSLGIKVPNSKLVGSEDDVKNLHPPLMLKCLRGGYDGGGNFLYQNLSMMEKAQEFISAKGTSLAQEVIQFDTEVAVIIARDHENTFSFPVVETIQENNICHLALTPARLPEKLQLKIQTQAKQLIEAIGGVGVFGVEFFIRGEEIIFNEIAPRPHNSGHYSIEACEYSQFEALLHLADEHKLKPVILKTPTVGMLNILGNRNSKASFEGDERFFNHPNGTLHLYGKEESRIGRKMGHFTLMGQSSEKVLSELTELKQRYVT